MDELYPQTDGGPWTVRTQIVKQFADPRPYDLDEVNLAEYKEVKPPYDDWGHVAGRCAEMSTALAAAFGHAVERESERSGNIRDTEDE
jgi:hypothetical protein